MDGVLELIRQRGSVLYGLYRDEENPLQPVEYYSF